MTEYIHDWEHEGVIVTFTWLGDVEVHPDRVYAIAFTPEGKMLLVTDDKWKPKAWLPGGGVEAGETPEEALKRELAEEASARVQALRRFGIQHAKDSLGRVSHQAFYWCRVTADSEFAPEQDGLECLLVDPEDFLDTLFWGRSDPKGAMLLERAREIERSTS